MSEQHWKETSFNRALEQAKRVEDEQKRAVAAGRLARRSSSPQRPAHNVPEAAPSNPVEFHVDERVRRKIERIHGVDFGLSTFSAASQALLPEHKAIIDAMARGDSDSAIARSLRMTVTRMRAVQSSALGLLAFQMKKK